MTTTELFGNSDQKMGEASDHEGSDHEMGERDFSESFARGRRLQAPADDQRPKAVCRQPIIWSFGPPTLGSFKSL